MWCGSCSSASTSCATRCSPASASMPCASSPTAPSSTCTSCRCASISSGAPAACRASSSAAPRASRRSSASPSSTPLPTLLEFALTAAIFAVRLRLVLSRASSPSRSWLYIWFTVRASDWRITIRRDMNDSDTDANTKAIDSLLNFETVKYFGNETMEAERFDRSMARYEKAATQIWTSLGWLNFGQGVIFGIGMMVMHGACRRCEVHGRHADDRRFRLRQRHADAALRCRSTSSASSTARSARA